MYPRCSYHETMQSLITESCYILLTKYLFSVRLCDMFLPSEKGFLNFFYLRIPRLSTKSCT